MTAEQSCPRCGTTTDELLPVRVGTRLALKTVVDPDKDDTKDTSEESPEMVCANCLGELQGKISQGALLRAEMIAKEKNRQLLWKSRIELVKQGRTFMNEKSFPEAAVNFEKYVRVVEIAHSLDSGQLTPELFSKSSHSKELTVIAATYWDLFRIYDGSSLYKDRMSLAGEKLLLFLPFSPLHNEIQKKAEAFARKAKNAAIAKNLAKKLKGNLKSCFVATSAFEDPMAPEVCFLRGIRDHYLDAFTLGRLCIKYYYLTSPPVAHFLDQHNVLKPAVRALLRFFILGIKMSLNFWRLIKYIMPAAKWGKITSRDKI